MSIKSATDSISLFEQGYRYGEQHVCMNNAQCFLHISNKLLTSLLLKNNEKNDNLILILQDWTNIIVRTIKLRMKEYESEEKYDDKSLKSKKNSTINNMVQKMGVNIEDY